MSLKTVVIMVLGLFLLYGLFTVGLPFLLALVAAIFLEPVTALLIKYAKMNRIASGTLVSTVFTILTLTLFYFIGLNVVTELAQFARRVPAYFNEASLYADQAMKRTRLFYESLSPEMAKQVQMWLEKVTNSLIDTAQDIFMEISGSFLSLAGKIPSFFVIFTVFVIALYLFTYGLPMLKRSFLSLFESSSRGKVEEVLENLRQAVFGFVRAQLIMAVFTYLCTFIGLLLLDAEYPLAIAVLVMVMEFVPVVGTAIIFIPWAGYQLLAGHTGYAVSILILFLAVTLFRRIVEPKVLSDAVGINALSVLISLYAGFELFGTSGLFLGPLAVIIYQAMRKAGLLHINIRLD